MTTPLKKIVIVGGGAGGLELATQLGKKLGRNKKAKITLVDRNHSHLWKPLLHEVATGSLDEGVDALSYLAHARNHDFQFQLGSVVDINRETKTITLAELHNEKGELLVPERKLPYDTLVMALGSTSNDFNTPGVKENCIFLDNPHQARRFHQEMLDLFLKYSANLGANGKVNIAIVGGGATGVELSAELHNAVKQLHSYGYKGLTNEALNVTLVEAGERILPALPPRISGAAHSELTKLGVRVLTKTMVTSADANGLHTKEGEFINADLMVWAAGIKAPDFMKEIGGLETNRINQLVVEPTLQTTRDAARRVGGGVAVSVARGVAIAAIDVLTRAFHRQSTVAHSPVDVCIVGITRPAPGVHQPDPPGLIHDDLRLLPPWRGSSLFRGRSFSRRRCLFGEIFASAEFIGSRCGGALASPARRQS